MTILPVDSTSAPDFLRRLYAQDPIAAKMKISAAIRSGRARDRVEKIIEALESCSYSDGFVVLEDGRVVGAVSYRIIPVRDFADFYTSSTDPWSNDPGDCVSVGYLGSISPGAGSQLMGAVEEIAKASRIPVLLRSTSESIGFYRKLGYRCRNGTCRKAFALAEKLFCPAPLGRAGQRLLRILAVD